MATTSIAEACATAGNITRTAAGKAAARKFNAVDRDIACLKVGEAQTICRVVSLATAAQIDAAVDFFDSDPSASRWLPSIEPACERLRQVRAILCETMAAPALDWFTPLSLLEALGAAMWHRDTPGGDAVLEHDDLVAFLRITIGALDNLADGLRNAGLNGQEG